MKGKAFVEIVNGSGKIGVHVEDETIVTAEYYRNNDSKDFLGSVYITPGHKGKTIVSLTDSVSRIKQTLSVKVTDSYAGLTMEDGIHHVLVPQPPKRYIAILVNDKERSCLFYTYADYRPVQLVDRGTYRFDLTGGNGDPRKNIPTLTLTYHESRDGILDSTGYTRTELFDMSKTLEVPYGGKYFFDVLDHFLDIGLNANTDKRAEQDTRHTRTSPIFYPGYRMDKVITGDETRRSIIGKLKKYDEIFLPQGAMQ